MAYARELFGAVYEVVRADYVEKPDDNKLVASAINGMLAGLDLHSSYMDPGSLRDLQVQTRGEFGGLGIEVTMEDGLVKVVAPIDETPAAKAGVMANDIITKLDDEQVHGLTLNQAVEKMRGPANTKIKLTIMRKGQDKPIDVSIVRDVIRVKSVRSHTDGDDVGYIRVTHSASASEIVAGAQAPHQIAPDTLDDVPLVVEKSGDRFQQRLQPHATITLPHQLPIGKTDLSRRRSHTAQLFLPLGRLGPLSLQCLHVARCGLLQQLLQSTSVIQSALHLGHKLFGHVDCNPPPLLPAVEDVTSMLLPRHTSRTILAHAGTAAKAQRAKQRGPKPRCLALQPANDIR